MADQRPGAILFACNANRVRSPMAEALMKRFYGREVYVDSCGLKPESGVDSFVEVVMDEIGLDTTGHRSKSFDDLEDGSFDIVISLTPQAQHRAVELSRGRATEIEYWPTPDPTLVSGSREAVLEAYRHTRDQLAARIVERFGRPITGGG